MLTKWLSILLSPERLLGRSAGGVLGVPAALCVCLPSISGRQVTCESPSSASSLPPAYLQPASSLPPACLHRVMPARSHASQASIRTLRSLRSLHLDAPHAQIRPLRRSARSDPSIRTLRTLRFLNSDAPHVQLRQFGRSAHSDPVIRTLRTFRSVNSDAPHAQVATFRCYLWVARGQASDS